MGGRRFRRPCIILNPQAASGKARRLWPRLSLTFEKTLGPIETRFTQAPGHATELARDALDSDADLVVAIGGDGTANEVANGFFRDGKPISPDASMAVCPLGTGGDFRRSAGIPPSPFTAIEALAVRPTRRIDACRLRVTSRTGTEIDRYFINVTSFGMGGEVSVAAKNSFLTPHSGRAAFLWATAVSIFRYRAKSVVLSLDGDKPTDPVSIIQVALGNGGYQGGGMFVCPLASLDSGTLEVTLVEDTGFFDFLRSIPLLYSGKIYSHQNCHHFRVRKLTAVADETVAVEIDGEALGVLPLEAEILPGAILMAGTEAAA